MERLGDEAGKYAGEKLFQKKAPTPKPHGDIIMKELTKDQEKNADFEARLSRLIPGAGKKNNIIYYNIECSDLQNIVIVMITYQSSYTHPLRLLGLVYLNERMATNLQ